MNKALFLKAIIFAAPILPLLAGCSEDGEPAADVRVDIEEIRLADNKLQSVDITVHSNVAWSAEAYDQAGDTPSWFYLVESSSQAGINTLTITVSEPNPSYDNERRGRVDITAGGSVVTIPVIQPARSYIIDVDNILIEGPAEHTLRRNGELQLTAVIVPADATNQNVSWESSDPNIAAVDDSGNVTTLSYGNAVITARSEDGNKTASVSIDVVLYMSGDYYPDHEVEFSSPGVVSSGTLPVGVVLSTSNFGRNGVIVSLDEGVEKWSLETVDVGTDLTISTDGLVNTNKVASEKNIDDYPAFKWCVAKQTGNRTWYLPAIDEVNGLYDFYNADRGRANALFIQAGGIGFDTQGPWYASSTEVDSGGNWPAIFWMVSWGDRYNGHGVKNGDPCAVRAFSKF